MLNQSKSLSVRYILHDTSFCFFLSLFTLCFTTQAFLFFFLFFPQELNAEPVIPEGFPQWADVMNTWGRKMIAAVEVTSKQTFQCFLSERDVEVKLETNWGIDWGQNAPLFAPNEKDLVMCSFSGLDKGWPQRSMWCVLSELSRYSSFRASCRFYKTRELQKLVELRRRYMKFRLD